MIETGVYASKKGEPKSGSPFFTKQVLHCRTITSSYHLFSTATNEPLSKRK